MPTFTSTQPMPTFTPTQPMAVGDTFNTTTGLYSYVEPNALTALGFKSVLAIDAIASTDTLSAKLGLKTTITEANASGDVLTGRIGVKALATDVDVKPGGAIGYADTGLGKLGVKALISPDTLNGVDGLPAKLGLYGALTDVYTPARPLYAYETLRGKIGWQSVVSLEVVAGIDGVSGKLGANASVLNALAQTEHVSGNAGLKSLQMDSKALQDAVTGNAGLRASLAESSRFRETLFGKIGEQAGAADVARAVETLFGKIGLKPGVMETTAILTTTLGKVGLKSSVFDGVMLTETLIGKLGCQASVLALARSAELLAGKIGLKSSLVDMRGVQESAAGFLGLKSGQSDALSAYERLAAPLGVNSAVTDRFVRGLSAGQLNFIAKSPNTFVSGTLPNLNVPVVVIPGNLIEACRVLTQATLPELVMIPETLAQSPILSGGKLPFLVLVAEDPIDVSESWQIKAVAQQITIDFVYVTADLSDGSTDDAQRVRARLDVLQTAFYANYHLGNLVTQLKTPSVPANKQNEYEQYFQSKGQPVTVMALRLAFTQVKAIR